MQQQPQPPISSFRNRSWIWQTADPAQELRGRIRKTGNAIGLTFLFAQVGVNSLLTLVTFFLSVSSADWLLSKPLYAWGQQLFFTCLCFTFPFVLCAAVLRFHLGDLILFRSVPGKWFVPLVLLCMGCFALGNSATNGVYSILSFLGFPPSSASLDPLEGGPFGFLLTVLISAALPALCEEFALRGVVLGLTRRFGDGFAIFVSAALFALMHGNLIQIPFAFVCGLGLGYVTVISGSLLPAMVAHFCNNFLATVLDQIRPESVALSGLLDVAYVLLFCLLGLVGFVLLVHREPNCFSLPMRETRRSFGKKLRAFTGNPGIILFLILTGVELILFF